LICGSGPSLDTEAVLAEGLPIAAVSTAIGWFEAPTYAILADVPNPKPWPIGHGKDIKQKLLRPDVTPVSMESLASSFVGCNAELFKIYTPHGKIEDRTPMDGSGHIAWVVNRSMPCAVQWLAQRFDCLIFCGVDLVDTKAHINRGHIRPAHLKPRKKGFMGEASWIKKFYEIATARGDTWLSWVPDPCPLNQFMAPYEPGRFNGTNRDHRAPQEAGGHPADLRA